MKERKGEKIGWIGGWTGGFLWVLILAAVRFFQKSPWHGIVGLVIACTAFFLVFRQAPWRSPKTPYWKLMLPIYALFAASAFWAFWTFDAFSQFGSHGWTFLTLLPCFTPLFTIGRRTWNALPE